MLCEKPYMIGVLPCACGKCFPCRINRRRLWAHRMQLESLVSSDASFVTLTYDDQHVPPGQSLVVKDYQDWLKRLRKVLAPQKIRYFLVGEYGDETQRPHYHAALFGVHPLIAGGFDGELGVVQSSWNKGFTYVGELTPDSAMYVAGYCTKKMTSRKDSRLNGRQPEFARMSLRPGIGAYAVEDIARSLDSDVGLRSIEQSSDVPFALLHGKRSLPLGRYLRGKLREKCGLGSRETPLKAQENYALSLRFLHEDGLKNAKNKALWNWSNPSKIVLDRTLQKINNLRSRTGIFEQEKSL